MDIASSGDNSGLVTVASSFSVRATIDRLVDAGKAAGLLVFGQVDHAANAAKAGLDLRPTELVIFGNPVGGTPLMQEQQTAGIDLPVKALAWEDEDGDVWLTYNSAAWLAGRHGLTASGDTIKAIEGGLEAICKHATSQ